MDLIIIVIAIVILISLVVVMFRYAEFIHQGPSSGDPDEKQEQDENPSKKGEE